VYRLGSAIRDEDAGSRFSVYVDCALNLPWAQSKLQTIDIKNRKLSQNPLIQIKDAQEGQASPNFVTY
jgi:hypothetical protein